MERAQKPGHPDVSPGPSLAFYVLLSFSLLRLFSVCKMRVVISAYRIVVRIKCEMFLSYEVLYIYINRNVGYYN